jgi:hypothetical protein
MKPNSDFKDLLRCFNGNAVEYLVVGGYAFIHFVEPRYTRDFDVWVRASPGNARKVYRALEEFGAPVRTMTPDDFAHEGYWFSMGRPPSRIDIMMSVKGLDFAGAWRRRVEGDFDGEKVLFVSKVDLITAKLAAGRPRDLVDAKLLTDSLGWEQLPGAPVKRKRTTGRPRRASGRRGREGSRR